MLVREAVPVTGASTSSTATGLLPRRKFSEISTTINGNLVIVKSHHQPDRLLMYEFAMPYLDRPSHGVLDTLSSEEARIPLVIACIGATLYYQLYYKEGSFFKNKTMGGAAGKKSAGGDDKSSDLMSGFAEEARRKGKLTPKMEKDMAEI